MSQCKRIATQPIASMLLIAATLAGAAAVASEPPNAAPLPESALARVVFLGDSVTDGYTYPQLVRDSLAKSGVAMVAINAGAGGDTMAKMRARLDRDVLPYNPTLVTISAGDNDSVRGVTAAQYEADMRATVEVLQARHIEVILCTPVWQPSTRAITDTYEAAIREIAASCHLRVAEVTRGMIDGQAAGLPQHCIDNHHPGYIGQHTIARALLDAMGYPNTPVVDRVDAVLDDNVIDEWAIRPVARGELPITDNEAAALSPDATWKTVKTPFDRIDLTGSNWDSLAWLDDFRREGMATQLDKNVAPGDTFLCMATIEAHADESTYLQTGADDGIVWLNGVRVFTLNQAEYPGWHPGRDAIVVNLKKGENKIVVLSGRDLWLRIAAEPLWGDEASVSSARLAIPPQVRAGWDKFAIGSAAVRSPALRSGG